MLQTLQVHSDIKRHKQSIREAGVGLGEHWSLRFGDHFPEPGIKPWCGGILLPSGREFKSIFIFRS